MEAGFGGADRDAQRRRDLWQGHPEVVMQDNDGTPLRIESAERCVKEIAIGDNRRDVRGWRSIERRKLDLDRAPASTPDRIDAGAEDQSVEPGVEPIGITQARQVPPGSDVGILDRVSRELLVPEDESGRRVQPRDERAGKHGKGVMIASPRSFDELSLVHGHPL
jgi:hypothetical protein